MRISALRFLPNLEILYGSRERSSHTFGRMACSIALSWSFPSSSKCTEGRRPIEVQSVYSCTWRPTQSTTLVLWAWAGITSHRSSCRRSGCPWKITQPSAIFCTSHWEFQQKGWSVGAGLLIFSWPLQQERQAHWHHFRWAFAFSFWYRTRRSLGFLWDVVIFATESFSFLQPVPPRLFFLSTKWLSFGRPFLWLAWSAAATASACP